MRGGRTKVAKNVSRSHGVLGTALQESRDVSLLVYLVTWCVVAGLQKSLDVSL